jgi:hypothetical protein
MDLASYAPLNGSLVQRVAQYRRKHPSDDEEIPFYDVRDQATRDMMEQASRGRVDTTWLCKMLTSVSPEGNEVTRDLLWLWKQKGALRYVGEEYPNVHSAVALVIARRFHRGQRRWNPPMAPDEPLFYCKIEMAPGEPTQMIAYPFEQDDVAYLVDPTSELWEETIVIPPRPSKIPTYQTSERTAGWYRISASALVYTPYAGVTLREDGSVNPEWLRVNGGGIRFFGQVSLKDVAHWDHHIERMGLDEFLLPDIVATAKTLALQLLAYKRLANERDAVTWKAPHL